jgi:RNA polymerase sigma-70 factor (ECF subfamily)
MAILTDGVFVSMPPGPLEYEGRDVVVRFCALLFRAGRKYHLDRICAMTRFETSVLPWLGLPRSLPTS